MARATHSDSDKRAEPVRFRGRCYTSPKGFINGTHRTQNPGETLRTIQPFLARAGVTRIADVTGLDNVGVPTTLALRPNAMTMACSSGKGITEEQAYSSGAMEAFELFAAETARLPSVQASYTALASRYDMPPVERLPLSARTTFSRERPIHWFLGWDFVSQSEVPVPLATVGMGTDESLVSSLGIFNVSSNGLGAGNSFLEAITAGLYEVIERDAVACRYYSALHKDSAIPVLSDDQLRTFPLVASVLDKCNAAGVKILVHDCTVDTQVPVYDAIAYDTVDRGVGVVCGSGAHLDPEVALLRAITEALQARLNFIAGSRDDIFRTAFRRFRAEWARAVEIVELDSREAPPASLRRSYAADTFEVDIRRLVRGLGLADLHQVIVADLTPAEFPVFVVRVLVPGLEGYMHGAYHAGTRAKNFGSLRSENDR